MAVFFPKSFNKTEKHESEKNEIVKNDKNTFSTARIFLTINLYNPNLQNLNTHKYMSHIFG